MEPKKLGNKKIPDFKELEDRVIAENSNEPSLVIKTNLDPQNVREENPYYRKKAVDEEKFSQYFQE